LIFGILCPCHKGQLDKATFSGYISFLYAISAPACMGSIICYVSGIFLCMANLCLGCLQEYMLKAKFGLPSIEAEETVVEKRPPIRVKFEIPYFTVSGIQVKF
jgi:hypothetical protein